MSKNEIDVIKLQNKKRLGCFKDEFKGKNM